LEADIWRSIEEETDFHFQFADFAVFQAVSLPVNSQGGRFTPAMGSPWIRPQEFRQTFAIIEKVVTILHFACALDAGQAKPSVYIVTCIAIRPAHTG